MTKKLVWRLKEQPTTESLRELVKDGLLTKDEARQILMSYNDAQEEKDTESLKEEVAFLRKLVDKLSEGRATETIKYIETWHPRIDRWYHPYQVYCQQNALFDATGAAAMSVNLASLN